MNGSAKGRLMSGEQAREIVEISSKLMLEEAEARKAERAHRIQEARKAYAEADQALADFIVMAGKAGRSHRWVKKRAEAIMKALKFSV